MSGFAPRVPGVAGGGAAAAGATARAFVSSKARIAWSSLRSCSSVAADFGFLAPASFAFERFVSGFRMHISIVRGIYEQMLLSFNDMFLSDIFWIFLNS
jgi:hypothetical protein